MKRKRWLAMALVFCLLGTTVPLTALAAGEDGEVQYIVSNDGTTLTIQGDGEITSQALNANVTAEQKKTLTSVEIGAGVTGIADGYSSVFPAGVTNVTLKGSGAFRFGKYSFKGQKNLTVQSERTSLAIGSYAFHNAVLTEFPMDQLHTIGSYGFSNAVLPLEGETLTLRIEEQVDVEAQYPAISVGSCAFSGVKNKEGTAFSKASVTIGGTVQFGDYSFNASDVFGSSAALEELTFHLKEGAYLIFGGGALGIPALRSAVFTGTGQIDFQHPSYRYVQAAPFRNGKQVETLDFSGFTGEITFAKNMFHASATSKPGLKQVILGEGCQVTKIREKAFAYCTQLETFDFSKVTGEIAGEAFRDTGLKGALDLSRVTAIEVGAFENVTGVTDWSAICQGAEAGILKKLEYSNVFLKDDAVWDLVERAMDGKFRLNQDGGYPTLRPTDNAWEDSHLGEKNGLGAASTQLTKAAKWTNEDRTTAQVEIQAAYAPDRQRDFVFVLDTSTSMEQVNGQGAALNKMYEMLSKVADVTETLLTSQEVDSRVAVLSFGSGVNAASAGFFQEANAAHAGEVIRGLSCEGRTNYTAGLEKAVDYLRMAQSLGRSVSVVFLSDGEANEDTEGIPAAAQAIQALGVSTIGVLYKREPTEQEKTYMDQACTEFYLAEDTDGFSRAVNRTIYDAFRTFTLTDVVGEDFQTIQQAAIQVTGGTATLAEDGRTVTWDLSGTEPYETYTMTLHLTLAPGQDGTYPAGTFATNQGESVLREQGTEKVQNQVASPQLRRGIQDGGGGGGGGGETRYTLRYDSRGGTSYPPEQYPGGTKVLLEKVPIREGYTFTGWYGEETLSKRLTEVTMTSDRTVYAGWQATSVPDMLNGADHFAYVIGYPDGQVKPGGSITRAEVATIFFRLLKQEIRDGNLTRVNGFTDVQDGSWFQQPVSTMSALGILKGRTEERFAPNAPITRAEFAAICARFDTGVSDGCSEFTDLAGHWAREEIGKAASLGWIQGYEDGTFRPDQSITRAEAMTMINRVLNRLPAAKEDLLPGMLQWPDNQDPGAWYYLAVQEATNSHTWKEKGEISEQWTELTEAPDWSRYET